MLPQFMYDMKDVRNVSTLVWKELGRFTVEHLTELYFSSFY